MNTTRTLLKTAIGDGRVYHGSATRSIREFKKAEEATIGNGAYFTSEEQAAKGYARLRARELNGVPVLYAVDVTGLKFLDLRDCATLDIVMNSFAGSLSSWLQATVPEVRKPTDYFVRRAAENALRAIRMRDYWPGGIRNVTWSHCQVFSEYVKSLGYDGLIAIEGGEGSIGNHDTWLVIEPEGLKVVEERILE